MIDLKTGKDMSSDNHFDYVRQLEVITEELPYGIKQYKEQVAELVSMDKRLSALQDKADRNASSRLADKIDSLAAQYVAAYNRCESALSVINEEIKKANVLFVKLSDYYASVGNVKAAKRVRKSLDKFENDNAKALDGVIKEISAITGQHAVATLAKKSVANFKLREGMKVGVKVTLRQDRMWEFLDRLFNVALPRVRDFRGISADAFDGRGNYSLGLKEQIIFPEIEYDKIEKLRGMNIAITTTAQTDEEARELLKLMGAPFMN